MTTQVATKFHINNAGEVLPCVASVRDCDFGDKEEHFPTAREAREAYEEKMRQELLSSVEKKAGVKRRGSEVSDERLLRAFDEMEFDEIEEIVNYSRKNHEELDRAIDLRAEEALRQFEQLEKINPEKNKVDAADKKTHKSLKKEFNAYKDKTASMVEAHVQSKFYQQKCEDLEDEKNIGNAVRGTTLTPNSTEWLEARFNAVGGSDVGVLVVMDFKDEDEIVYFDRAAMEKVEKSKAEMPDDETIAQKKWLSFDKKGGALYRGTVWEDRSRDKFVEDHPEMTVYNTKDQYYNPDRPWQQVNFDGVLSDRADKKPNGVLELKTGNDPDKWNDGPPLNYRAQVLYYLNSTKMDYAVIGVTLNDGAQKYFRIEANDPVAPGKYDKPMESYINERVEPWFNDIKKNRKN